jgi:Txe/YoeB family toxin of Txe-Axe toxin-antitoxin module
VHNYNTASSCSLYSIKYASYHSNNEKESINSIVKHIQGNPKKYNLKTVCDTDLILQITIVTNNRQNELIQTITLTPFFLHDKSHTDWQTLTVV